MIIKEQSDEFWESLKGSGCADIELIVDEVLGASNLSYDLKLIEYTDK